MKNKSHHHIFIGGGRIDNIKSKMDAKKLSLLFSILQSAVNAEESAGNASAIAIVDMMNAFLLLICAIFIFAIVSTFRNSKLLSLVRSAHFFKIKKVITAWTFLGSAVLLYALTELLFAFNVIGDLIAYKLLKTVFGVIFAAGLFLQYMVLLRYVKQVQAKKQKEKKLS